MKTANPDRSQRKGGPRRAHPPGAAAKPLIIAEKPSAARAIADALGGFRSARSHLESADYLLTWAVGHLVELAPPEVYDSRWRRWSLQSLPIMPDRFQLQPVARTRSQLQAIAGLIKQAGSLINACDAGREGELIFRYIVSLLGADSLPVQRLWVSSLTRAAIRKGFAELQPAAAYDRLYASALCRAQGDWLVGLNATRAFTCRYGELLSLGRVQTPTLALLVRREQELRAFVPTPYWEVHATFQTAAGETYSGQWQGPDGGRLPAADQAAAVADRVRGCSRGVVSAREDQEVREPPPQLFDLTSLQREANRRFGLTAAATLRAAQDLYEQKLITYPRTDSRYLSRDVAQTLERTLAALARVPAYATLVAGGDRQRIWNGRVVNDARVTDHHAMIPTGEPVPALTGNGARIFDLVARRTLAQTYPAAVYRQLQVTTLVGQDAFLSRGRQVLDPGWRAAEPPPARRPARRKGEERGARSRPEGEERGTRSRSEGEDGDDLPPLPPVQSGDPVTVAGVEAVAKETQPPRRYTEAALLAAMETAGKQVEDEDLREAMKGRGLGTPATRAAIIERLKAVGYIAARGKALVPTEKGERLVALAAQAGVQVLLSPDLTGEWEKRIADIQAGSHEPAALMAGMRQLAQSVVEQVRRADTHAGASSASGAGAGAGAGAQGTATGAAVPAGTPVGTCPRCGEAVNRTGRDWRCGGCALRIPGYLCGKVIDAEVAGVLLREGRTALLTGFRSPRTGKDFAAYLVLAGEKVAFAFPPFRGQRAAGKGRGRRTT